MANLDLTGAEVLWATGLSGDTLSFAHGEITADPVGRPVDLTGFLVLPGIVDVHGDGFERHVAPRRGAMKQMVEGLTAVEAELAANGITTGVLAQFISWEGGLRSPEFADQVFSTLRDVARHSVTDMRALARFETHQLDLYEDLPAQLAEWQVNYVVFSDHLPHDRLASGQQPRRLVSQALKAARSPEKHLTLMQELHGHAKNVPAALDALCARLAAQGVQMGSHDDQTALTRTEWAARGVVVAEFPETLEAAEATDGPVVMGAPNVVRGGSHNGNLSALDLVMMGQCDALASDYHYPSPRRAALMLWQSGVLDLTQAWALVSKGPAGVLGLSDRGVLEPGKRADLVIVHRDSLRVAATLVQGQVSFMSGEIAERFIG